MYAKYVQQQNNGGTVDKLRMNVILRKILQHREAFAGKKNIVSLRYGAACNKTCF